MDHSLANTARSRICEGGAVISTVREFGILYLKKSFQSLQYSTVDLTSFRASAEDQTEGRPQLGGSRTAPFTVHGPTLLPYRVVQRSPQRVGGDAWLG